MISGSPVVNNELALGIDVRPLAARMRPRNLAEYIGQEHLIGEQRPLRQAIEKGLLHSMILWGPPGTGKTTLANLFSQHAHAQFVTLSAVTSGVKEIRQAIDEAKQRQHVEQQQTVLFIDEVHRFNKSQQDAFLPHIEDGTIIFVGATTENPAFELNNALLSRTRVYRLKELTSAAVTEVIEQALQDRERGLGERNIQLDADALNYLVHAAAGDARRALNLLEIATDASLTETIDLAAMKEAVGARQAHYDKGGDVFYDLLSALHKSIRGSAADAGLYWYARILNGGGDPLMVARRLLAIASEDIGLADPRAMQLCLNAWDSFVRLGPAEGERAIAEALVYCALAPKSNSLYQAFNKAKALAKQYPDAPIPKHIRNAPTALHKAEGYGADYRYAHNETHAYVPGERYLPSIVAAELVRTDALYTPSERGLEKQLAQKLEWLRQLDQSSDWQREGDNDE